MSDQPPPENGRGKIAALLAIVLLIAGGIWLTHRLSDTASIQDCVSTGRHDCGP